MRKHLRLHELVLIAGAMLCLVSGPSCNGYTLNPPVLVVTDPEWLCVLADTKEDCEKADAQVAQKSANDYCAWYPTSDNPDSAGWGFRDKALSGLNPPTLRPEVEDAAARGLAGLCRSYIYVPPKS